VTSIWLLASTLSLVTTLALVAAFQQSSDRSLMSLVLWFVIAVSLVAPLALVRSLLRTSALDAATMRTMAFRIILVAYVPLQCALVLASFGR
jgi:hypothetical protein